MPLAVPLPGVRERRPQGLAARATWNKARDRVVLPPGVSAASAWLAPPLGVVSMLVTVDRGGSLAPGLSWHLMVSRHGFKPSDEDLQRVRADFGLQDASELTIGSSLVRMLWCPAQVDVIERGAS